MVKFIRVRDAETGHQLDVREDDWRLKASLFKKVNQTAHPPSSLPRPMKPKLAHIKPYRRQAL